MTLLPSSNSCLNNARLAGSYLSLMFCASPKPLRKRSGLCLYVTSNNNFSVVNCVQTTRDIQKSNTAFLKKSESSKKLNYLKQILLSKNKKKIMSKRNSPFLPHSSACRTVDQCFHISRMVRCKYTHPEPSTVPKFCDIAFRWL